MKKLLMILVMLTFGLLSSGQDYATLRVGSIDASTISIGDTILIPVYCDEIININPIRGFDIWIDHDYIFSYTGTILDPLGGLYYTNPAFPFNPADWFISFDGFQTHIQWIDPTYFGTQINSGETLFIVSYIYQGGETQLVFDEYSGFMLDFEMTLIDGCVCYFSDANFPSTHNFSFFPNPTHGEFVISSDLPVIESLDIRIIDLTGNIVFSNSYHSIDKILINLSDQPKGLYFIQLKSGERVWNEKLVLQ